MNLFEAERRSPDKGLESGFDRDPVPAVRIIPVTFKSVQELRTDLENCSREPRLKLSLGEGAVEELDDDALEKSIQAELSEIYLREKQIKLDGEYFDEEQIEDTGLGETSVEEIEFTRSVLTKKSKVSKVSAGLIMPLGGKVIEGDSALQSAERIIRRETLIVPMGMKSLKGDSLFQPSESYQYNILGLGRSKVQEQDRKPREVSFLLYPVLPPEFTIATPRHPQQDKIQEFEWFTPNELRNLVELETSDQVAGHFTMQPSDDIEIGKEQEEGKNLVLQEVLERVDDFEAETKVAIIEEVNSDKERRGEVQVDYLSECTNEEIVGAFEKVNMRWFLREEAVREQKGIKCPSPGIDLLKFAWLLSGEGMDINEMGSLVFDAPTENIRKNMRHIFLPLRRALSEVYGRDEELKIEKIRSKFSSMNPQEKVKNIEALEEVCLREYARYKGVSQEEVFQVKREIDGFFQSMVEQSMQMHEYFSTRFQAGKVSNDIVNSPLVNLIFLALGINPLSPDEEIVDDRLLRRTQHEAMRHLAFLAKGIEAKQRYSEIMRNGNLPIESVFSGLFTLPYSEYRRRIGERHSEVVHERRTHFKVDGGPLIVFIDEKPVKDFYSFLRKSFYEPLEEIYDVFSRNIVLADAKDKGEYDLGVVSQFRKYAKAQISKAHDMEREIKERLMNEYGDKDGWQVEFIGEKNSYSQVRKKPEDLRLIEDASGKRAGSVGKRIVRSKFYVVLTDPKGKQYSDEIVIYPFTSFKNTAFEGLLWGHDEKLEDDAIGGYKLRRLIEPEPDYPDIPPLYFLLFPPHIYREEAGVLYTKPEEFNEQADDFPIQALESNLTVFLLERLQKLGGLDGFELEKKEADGGVMVRLRKVVPEIPVSAYEVSLEELELSKKLLKRLKKAGYKNVGIVMEHLAGEDHLIGRISGMNEDLIEELQIAISGYEFPELVDWYEFRREGNEEDIEDESQA